MRVLVCGGRQFDDASALRQALDRAHDRMVTETGEGFTLVIEGGAKGADCLAREWALGRGIEVQTVQPDWMQHGRAAGPIRNAEMLRLTPDLVIAFPGGNGTADMMRRAREVGVPVIEVLDSDGPAILN